MKRGSRTPYLLCQRLDRGRYRVTYRFGLSGLACAWLPWLRYANARAESLGYKGPRGFPSGGKHLNF